MSIADLRLPATRTAADLRRLAPEQRDAILASAAAAAAAEYRENAELTAFEAFGEDDLHGHSSDSQPG